MQVDVAALLADMCSSCKSLQALINQTSNRKTKRYQAETVSVKAYTRLQCCFAQPAKAVTAQYPNALMSAWVQDKKKAEADRQKELNDLFAIAIKQPKVPPGEFVIYLPQFAGFTACCHCICVTLPLSDSFKLINAS